MKIISRTDFPIVYTYSDRQLGRRGRRGRGRRRQAAARFGRQDRRAGGLLRLSCLARRLP